MTEAEQIKADLKLVERIDEFGEGCTEWEKGFLDSCLRRLKDERRSLSEKQRETAERIDEQRVK